MEFKDIVSAVRNLGLPSINFQWQPGKVPPLPYIVYLTDGRIDKPADNINYFKRENMVIELYSNEPDSINERRIESMLESLKLFYRVSSLVYLESESMYLRRYYFYITKGNQNEK